MNDPMARVPLGNMVRAGVWTALLVSLLATANAFRPRIFGISTLIRTTSLQRARSTALRFKVAEADDAVGVDDDVEFQNLGDSSSGIFQKLSKGFVPLAASIGFAATPSPVIATRLAGAAAGGVAGLIAKTLLASLARTSASTEPSDGGAGGGIVSLPATATVATTLERLKSGPPLSTLTVRQLEAAARKSGVSGEDLSELFTCVFAEVVYNAVRTDSEDLTELSEVSDFAKELGLSDAEIGDGFSLAAAKLSDLLTRDERGFYASNYPAQVLLYTAKIFFIADKMLGAFTGYFGKRFAVALSFFTPDTLRVIVSEASTKLFSKCVASVLADPGKFTAEEVEGLRQFLTSAPSVNELRPAMMQNMVMEQLQQTLDKSLKSDNAADALHARVANYEALQTAQEVLGWNPREFTATLETRTLPVFEAAARQIIEQAVDFPERAAELADALQERIEALNVDVRKARVALTTLISEKNSEYMFKIEKVYNASGSAVEPVFKVMTAYATSHAALKTLSERIMDGVEIPLPGLPFAEMVRVSMFQLKEQNKDSPLSADMFSLNEEQQRIVRKNMALPKVTSWIQQCVAESAFSADSKGAYKKLLQDNGVTEAEWRATSVDFYYQELQRVASTRAVPSEADMLRLTQLKEFLDCPEEAAARVNLELLGDKYAKAVQEAMTPAGVVTEEYLEGLERLRKRLALNKSDAESLLGLVTRNRLAPLIKDLASQWKSDTDANVREKGRKDKSGDPIADPDNVLGYMETGAQKYGGGPNVFMREALNLIDFVSENYLSQDVNIARLDTVPVSAVGTLPETELVGLFKHYLITELTEQDPELRARYFANEVVFGKLLGIELASQAKVKESLAYTAYKNMLKQVMRVKEAVGADELRQFAMLKESLQLDEETATRIYDECSRGALIETAAGIMRAKEGQVTADTARRLRTLVQSLGLDIQKDTGFNEKLVSYLYSLEVQSLVESDMTEELAEIQQAYDIPEERAAEIIEVSCVRYVSQILNFALRAAKKYDELEAVRVGRQILKYAAFISGQVDADANMYSTGDKDRLISFLLDEFRATGDDEGKEAVSRLKEMINLTEAYVPPLKGIEGLEGKIEKAPQYDDDKKKWSWG